jgi:hypothetical protein
MFEKVALSMNIIKCNGKCYQWVSFFVCVKISW